MPPPLRRQSRGLRPWFLIPKVLAVSVFLGTLIDVLVIWIRAFWHKPTHADVLALLAQTTFLFRFVAIPALVAILLLGAALFAQCPHAFGRMRWMRLKLISLIVVIPASHFYLSRQIAQVRGKDTIDFVAAAQGFARGLALAVVGFATIVVLGKLKPRLGQNWAHTWRSIPKR